MHNCRSCNSSKISSIIPLGNLPLANALLPNPKVSREPRYNLEVMLCEECGLAQLKDIIDPKALFSDYVYFSSNSDAMLKSVAQLAENIIPTLSRDAFIIEIASNDGYLLKNYVQKGIQALGIDPAENIAKVANANGIPTLCKFFTLELASELASQGKQADIIHANNVMAHVPDINGFILGLKTLLKEKGTAIIEVPYFLDLVQKIEFDTIYHEHVYYFTIQSVKCAFERHGLEVYDIEKINLHGGSLRLFVGHQKAHPIQANVDHMLAIELTNHLTQVATYEVFMKKLQHLKEELISKLTQLKEKGASIAAYGASAKGTTLLNYFGIGKEFINFVVDRSLVKQGMYTPGTQLEILSPENLIHKQVSHALLLTWNFAEEIISQQKEFLTKGGNFIVPLPEVKIIL